MQASSDQISSKVAVVTGGAKGLGMEWCRQLAQRGCHVYLTAQTMEKAKAAVDNPTNKGLSLIPFALNMGVEADMINLAEAIKANHGKVDILVNNAGINAKGNPDRSVFMQNFSIRYLDAQQVLMYLKINAVMPLILVRHLLPLIKKAVHPRIANISSWLGSMTTKNIPGHYSYSGSKALLNMFTKGLAMELEPEGVIVASFNPGWVKTDMGGPGADLPPEESVRGMLDAMLGLSIKDSGKFYNHDGSEHPW
jgi:NAD(P)-dependent dehydrogenase (short-subunit alcohol dehydrogenase family)